MDEDDDDNGKFRLERVTSYIASNHYRHYYFVLSAYQITVIGNKMTVYRANDFPFQKNWFSVSRFGEFRFIPFQRNFHRLLTKIQWLSMLQVTQIYNWITTQLLIAKIINSTKHEKTFFFHIVTAYISILPMTSNKKKLTSIIIANGKSADPSSPSSTHTRRSWRYWLYSHFPVTLAKVDPTLSHTTHAVIRESSADFGKLRLIYIMLAHASCTGTDPVLAE